MRRARAREARVLVVSTEAEVLVFTRVRTLGQRAVMVERSTWAPWVVPHMSGMPDDVVSTTQVLADAGIVVSSGNHRIEAVAAGSEAARLPAERRSSHLLPVRRATFASNRRPVEIAEDSANPPNTPFSDTPPRRAE